MRFRGHNAKFAEFEWLSMSVLLRNIDVWAEAEGDVEILEFYFPQPVYHGNKLFRSVIVVYTQDIEGHNGST